MDSTPLKERDVVIDIESGVDSSVEVESPDLSNDKFENVVSITVCGMSMSVDELIKGGNSVSLKNVGEVSPDSEKKSTKEKRKSTSGKKAPKPPRPPRGLSLDAADQKLIKEISELAMLKRARIERMKALKKLRAAKGSSNSISTSGNLIAMLFTILVCVVIIFQGCHPLGVSSRNSSSQNGIPGSLELQGAAEGNNILAPDSSIKTMPLMGVGSSNLPRKLAPGSDGKLVEAKSY